MDKLLYEIQDYLSNVVTHHNYVRKYRDEEQSYWRHIPVWLSEHMADFKNANVLDIGAAYGTLSAYCHFLLNANCHAVDFITVFFPEDLKKHIDFKICNIELEPVPWPDKFDLIIMTEIFEHFNFNPVTTLKKIRASMADDGFLLFSTPEAKIYGRTSRYYAGYTDMPEPTAGARVIDAHIFVYTWDEVVTIFERAGFTLHQQLHTDGEKHINAVFKKLMVCN